MNDIYRELLIGCGSKRIKDPRLPTAKELRKASLMQGRIIIEQPRDVAFQNLTTLDNTAGHLPDIIWDLTLVPFLYRAIPPRPVQNDYDVRNSNGELDLATSNNRYYKACNDWDAYYQNSIMADNYFDELHAYEVLEHIGQQGNYRLFFDQFSEFWRILKPGGFLFATVPSWASEWAWGDPSHTRVITSGTLSFLSQEQYKKQVGVTPMSDFRHIYKADFLTAFVQENSDHLLFVLQAIK